MNININESACIDLVSLSCSEETKFSMRYEMELAAPHPRRCGGVVSMGLSINFRRI